jgi:CHAT domain-containing protein
LAIPELLNAQPLTGNRATEAEVIRKIPTARIIHLATHGGIQSELAWMALAPSGTMNNNDGLLTSDEILNLEVNAELVVLSFGGGEGRVTADGILGLSRAWIAAGSPSVITALWGEISDQGTAELMRDFYKNLGLNKAQALRQAMLKTKEKYPNPRDWAGFIMIGEAE